MPSILNSNSILICDFQEWFIGNGFDLMVKDSTRSNITLFLDKTSLDFCINFGIKTFHIFHIYRNFINSSKFSYVYPMILSCIGRLFSCLISTILLLYVVGFSVKDQNLQYHWSFITYFYLYIEFHRIVFHIILSMTNPPDTYVYLFVGISFFV